MPLTHAQFAMQAAYLASRSSSWAGEVLGLPEYLQTPMRDVSITRFVGMLRETADRIEEMHNENPEK